MSRTTITLAATFGAAVLGLAILLISRAVSVSESFIMVGGIIALAGVSVLTGIMMRLPDPNEGEHGNGDDHA